MTIVDWCLDRLEPIYDWLADAYGVLDCAAGYVIDGLDWLLRKWWP